MAAVVRLGVRVALLPAAARPRHRDERVPLQIPPPLLHSTLGGISLYDKRHAGKQPARDTTMVIPGGVEGERTRSLSDRKGKWLKFIRYKGSTTNIVFLKIWIQWTVTSVTYHTKTVLVIISKIPRWYMYLYYAAVKKRVASDITNTGKILCNLTTKSDEAGHRKHGTESSYQPKLICGIQYSKETLYPQIIQNRKHLPSYIILMTLVRCRGAIVTLKNCSFFTQLSIRLQSHWINS